MNAVNSSPTVNLDWFDRKGVYLVPKKGYAAMIATAIRGETAQNQKPELSNAAHESEGKPTIHLSKEQIKSLSQKYNPQQMSKEEYNSFIDELCQLGILDEEDKPYLSCGRFSDAGLIPLSACRSSISLSETNALGADWYSGSFSSCKGNVIDWAKYLATFRELNPHTQIFEKGKRTVLFEKIMDILGEIQKNRS